MTINAGSSNFVMMIPFKSPRTVPIATAIKIGTMTGPLYSRDSISLLVRYMAQTAMAGKDTSIPPAIMPSISAKDMIPIMIPFFIRLTTLARVKNTGFIRPMIRHITTSVTAT